MLLVSPAIEDRLSSAQQSYAPASPGKQSMGWMGNTTADGEFDHLTQVMPHHQEAVTAAKQLRRSSRPKMMHGLVRHGEVAPFARSMRDNQHAETLQMQRHLAHRFGGRGILG
jgi:uncharacterized protein (DUF305 family)